MIAGFTATVLIAYNGIIDKPGSGPAEIGVGLDYGYWIALVCAIAIAVVASPARSRRAAANAQGSRTVYSH